MSSETEPTDMESVHRADIEKNMEQEHGEPTENMSRNVEEHAEEHVKEHVCPYVQPALIRKALYVDTCSVNMEFLCHPTRRRALSPKRP